MTDHTSQKFHLSANFTLYHFTRAANHRVDYWERVSCLRAYKFVIVSQNFSSSKLHPVNLI